jgi:hypothetical protein
MSYTKTLIKIPTFIDGKKKYITVDSDQGVWFYRNNMECFVKVHQICYLDDLADYYFTNEKDIKDYVTYIKREEKLNQIGI